MYILEARSETSGVKFLAVYTHFFHPFLDQISSFPVSTQLNFHVSHGRPAVKFESGSEGLGGSGEVGSSMEDSEMQRVWSPSWCPGQLQPLVVLLITWYKLLCVCFCLALPAAHSRLPLPILLPDNN